MKALIIDDSRAMRSILSHTLRQLGFEVSEAANGRDALALLGQTERPDLVLVDWNMPEMNGIEFVRAVRADNRYSDLPLMMVTTETETSHVVTALDAGANEYVMKPFTKDVIRQKIELLGLFCDQSSASSLVTGEPMRALVIDDSKSMRLILRHIFTSLGFEVSEANSGREGFEQLIGPSRFDLVLVDCYMPDMDGIEFIRAVRADSARDDIRLIMVTSEDKPGSISAAMHAGADEYLTKPFTREAVQDALEHLGVGSNT